jgi:hypothetical protein
MVTTFGLTVISGVEGVTSSNDALNFASARFVKAATERTE